MFESSLLHSLSSSHSLPLYTHTHTHIEGEKGRDTHRHRGETVFGPNEKAIFYQRGRGVSPETMLTPWYWSSRL